MKSQKDEVYLNLVLEFVPETVYRASRFFNKMKTTMPILEIKIYIYQSFARWPISIRRVSVIVTSNPRICYLTQILVS